MWTQAAMLVHVNKCDSILTYDLVGVCSSSPAAEAASPNGRRVICYLAITTRLCLAVIALWLTIAVCCWKLTRFSQRLCRIVVRVRLRSKVLVATVDVRHCSCIRTVGSLVDATRSPHHCSIRPLHRPPTFIYTSATILVVLPPPTIWWTHLDLAPKSQSSRRPDLPIIRLETSHVPVGWHQKISFPKPFTSMSVIFYRPEAVLRIL